MFQDLQLVVPQLGAVILNPVPERSRRAGSLSGTTFTRSVILNLFQDLGLQCHIVKCYENRDPARKGD